MDQFLYDLCHFLVTLVLIFCVYNFVLRHQEAITYLSIWVTNRPIKMVEIIKFRDSDLDAYLKMYTKPFSTYCLA